MKSEIEKRAKFDLIRYSQVWEDADLLVEALDLHADDIVLSIASAGDNAFALLAQNPGKVYAVDLSFAQVACCELRKAMYCSLTHKEHLIFGGVIQVDMDRISVFRKLSLPPNVRDYWENHMAHIENGFMTQGKFERYFRLFRKKVLPFVHTRRKIEALIAPKSRNERYAFYDEVWNNRRWRMMFNVFFSRFVMGRLGRDKEFFKYVEGSVADRILSRTKQAITELDPSRNPYLHFILYGAYNSVLPYALREENYNKIRNNLDKIEFRQASIEKFVAEFDGELNVFNLSDIFEYMTQESMDALYGSMLQKAAAGARFAYWNMLAPRRCSDVLCERYGVETNEEQNKSLLLKDKAFFYSKFYLDKVR
ncbi:MAG: BtaA family protein [Tannerella sp.]|jgi:S-adenosylmethionine-diacylglycerol 3-amino-3-carboxypropyl transferase|nr:BtaA family protein [Tannerella sp.]